MNREQPKIEFRETQVLKQESAAKELKIAEIQKQVEVIEDRLGKPIDGGIKESIIYLNAHELRTIQSCEGHPDEFIETREGISTPWVDIGPNFPENKKWYEDESLRSKLAIEDRKLRVKMQKPLTEFYKDRKVDYDVMLSGPSDPGWGFRLQSSGSVVLEAEPSAEKIQEKAKQYQKEMADFTEFLKKKYFEGTKVG